MLGDQMRLILVLVSLLMLGRDSLRMLGENVLSVAVAPIFLVPVSTGVALITTPLCHLRCTSNRLLNMGLTSLVSSSSSYQLSSSRGMGRGINC